ncbi:hypothetical protein ACFPM0_20570 [Pseudonocardia sulfidoxydans]|uniref:hypothetical protein n=1 Tax=Pseudonocardia sulfidoxydans TaxID=54011 RepID=UPI003623E032
MLPVVAPRFRSGTRCPSTAADGQLGSASRRRRNLCRGSVSGSDGSNPNGSTQTGSREFST